MVQVLGFYSRALRHGDLVGRVTLGAGQRGVLAFKRIAGLAVVEGPDIPLDYGKVNAVVLRVAGDAFLAGTWLEVITGVQALVRDHARRDLRMAIEAFECGLSPEAMTAGAVGGSVQELVRPRELAGRNLGQAEAAQP